MYTTLDLLAMPQDEALLGMIQDALIPGVSVSDLNPGGGLFLPNGDVRHIVGVRPEAFDRPGWIYQGVVDFHYHRIDLGDFFRDINLRLVVPSHPQTREILCHVSDVVGIICTIFDIVIDPSDYEGAAVVGPGPIELTLKARPSSLRWTGQVTMTLFPELPDTQDLPVNHVGLYQTPTYELKSSVLVRS